MTTHFQYHKVLNELAEHVHHIVTVHTAINFGSDRQKANTDDYIKWLAH